MSLQLSLEQQWEILQKSRKDFSHFKVLYEFYLPRIYKFIYIRVLQREVAEDLTSTVFLKLIEKVQHTSWNSIQSFIKYLYVIARNTLKNYYRDQKKTTDVLYAEPTESLKQEYIDLTSSLLKLPKKDQELVYLYYFQGFTMDEIAQVLEAKGSSIRMRHKRLLEKLTKFFDHES